MLFVLLTNLSAWTSSNFAQAEQATPGLVATSAGQVHNLAPGLAATTRVHLRATVSYYDPAEGLLFVQDATGGVYIDTDKQYPIKTGDLVDLTGRPSSSYRTQVALDPEIRVVGRGQTFPAPSYDYAQLVSGLGDCTLVTIRGKVLAADVEQHESAIRGHLDVAMAGGEVQVYLASVEAFHPESLLDATIEVKGVAGGAFDAKNQLTGLIVYATGTDKLRVLGTPSVIVAQLPLTDIDNVFQTRKVTNLSQRVRVRGILTYYKPGDAAVVQNNGKSIYAQTRQTMLLSVGDVVDVFGFASDKGYSPSLFHASIVSTGKTGTVVPQPVSYLEALTGNYSDNLVVMSGNLVSELHDSRKDTLVVDVDGHLVNSYLESKSALRDFALGSRIQIVGVCRIQPGGPWRTPYLFSLQMRNADDVRLLSKPSWWTVRHLIEVLSGLGLIVLSISAWAVILRRRVVEQTATIERSMKLASERSRILEKISSNHPPDELLSEICLSVMRLLPGVRCCYSLRLDEDRLIDYQYATLDQVLFQMVLLGVNDRPCGNVVVSAARHHPYLQDQAEVYANLSEMATLAMRQSLLHQSLVHHSTHDALTELPNRRLCETKLSAALDEARVQGGRLVVVYIDVDRFKHINDRYGHKVGDLYLRQVSARLQAQIRITDMLARIGGDEFLVIAPLTADYDYAQVLSERLKACFDEDFIIDGHTIHGSASLGLARFPQDGVTAEELQRKADHAMYLSKRNAAGTGDISQAISIITPAELEAALNEDRFRLVYQPQFSAEGYLTGLEALIRLEDPILGTLTPDAFISVAEHCDVILRMGAWVLNHALQEAKNWQLDIGPGLVLVVNVSAREMNETGFADRVLAALAEHDFPADRLELELTERSLVSDPDNAVQQLQRLRQQGVRVSLDDFGTGQSSLSLLHKLPIDTIKLDRSFILAMDNEPAVLPIIEAITLMARRLGKRVVAEGIEHTGPVPALLQMGRLDFQGYLLSRPLPSHEVAFKIAGWRRGIPMPAGFNLANGSPAEQTDR